MVKELSVILSEKEIQEALGGLKGRVTQTQGLMRENKGNFHLLNGLNRQRKTEEKLISKFRKALRTSKKSTENTEK